MIDPSEGEGGSSGRPVVIVEPTIDALDYVREDERLLRGGGFSVRTAVLRDRCLSYGIGVPNSAAYVRRAEREGIPTVRRSTGGTGLLHEPGDLAWSIVLPRGDPRVGRRFASDFARFGSGPVRFLAQRGVDSRWEDAPGLVPGYCTLSARGQVLSAKGRIVGGAAQHLTGAALLHHGTISFSVDRASIDRLFALEPKGPSARLSGLRDLGLEIPRGGFAGPLADAIVQQLGRVSAP